MFSVYLLDLSNSHKKVWIWISFIKTKSTRKFTLVLAIGKHKLNTKYLLALKGKQIIATGATALFNAGVPEKLIRDVTGHRSNALHFYERPTEEQKKQVSKIMMNNGSIPGTSESAPLGERGKEQAHLD